jgi:hypothetical protein
MVGGAEGEKVKKSLACPWLERRCAAAKTQLGRCFPYTPLVNSTVNGSARMLLPRKR